MKLETVNSVSPQKEENIMEALGIIIILLGCLVLLKIFLWVLKAGFFLVTFPLKIIFGIIVAVLFFVFIPVVIFPALLVVLLSVIPFILLALGILFLIKLAF